MMVAHLPETAVQILSNSKSTEFDTRATNRQPRVKAKPKDNKGDSHPRRRATGHPSTPGRKCIPRKNSWRSSKTVHPTTPRSKTDESTGGATNMDPTEDALSLITLVNTKTTTSSDPIQMDKCIRTATSTWEKDSHQNPSCGWPR